MRGCVLHIRSMISISQPDSWHPMLGSRFPPGVHRHEASQRQLRKVYVYAGPVDFRKSIDGLAALVELDIKVAVFDPVLFVFFNKNHNRVKIKDIGSGTTSVLGSNVSAP